LTAVAVGADLAVGKGDVARADLLTAQMNWERIGASCGSFNALGSGVSGLPWRLPGGVDDAGFAPWTWVQPLPVVPGIAAQFEWSVGRRVGGIELLPASGSKRAIEIDRRSLRGRSTRPPPMRRTTPDLEELDVDLSQHPSFAAR
jgi:hypothetical protein